MACVKVDPSQRVVRDGQVGPLHDFRLTSQAQYGGKAHYDGNLDITAEGDGVLLVAFGTGFLSKSIH